MYLLVFTHWLYELVMIDPRSSKLCPPRLGWQVSVCWDTCSATCAMDPVWIDLPTFLANVNRVCVPSMPLAPCRDILYVVNPSGNPPSLRFSPVFLWYIMMIYHHDISWWYIIMIYHYDISWWYIIMIYHDDISWRYIIMIDHDDISWWYIIMIYHDDISSWYICEGLRCSVTLSFYVLLY